MNDPTLPVTPSATPSVTPNRADSASATAAAVDGSLHAAGAFDQPATRADRRPLLIALVITSTFLVIEVVGALATNSLALLADAAHMLTDVAAISLALFAIWLAGRPARPERTFGYLRGEVLAALVNAVSLLVIAVYIFREAWQRLQEPPVVQSRLMLVVGIAGLLANVVSAWVLSRGSGHRDNLNTRGAFLHVVGDLLGSVAAITAAIIITLTGWYAADPILSAVIGGLIVFGAFSLLRDSVDVLLEAAPRGMVMAEIRTAMLGVPGVSGVHDLHVWIVTSGLTAMSGHVETGDTDRWPQTQKALTQMLQDRFGIAHATLQPEPPRSAQEPEDRCSIDDPDGRTACLSSTRTPVVAPDGHAH